MDPKPIPGWASCLIVAVQRSIGYALAAANPKIRTTGSLAGQVKAGRLRLQILECEILPIT